MRAWVNDWNGVFRPLVQRTEAYTQGAPGGLTPWVAYADEDQHDGGCERAWNWGQFSFTGICTSWNINAACNTSLTGVAGCAGAAGPSVHNGANYQPGIFIAAGLREPYVRKNAVTHEFGHVLCLGHRYENPNSVMFGARDGAYYGYDLHDRDHLRDCYRHGGD